MSRFLLGLMVATAILAVVVLALTLDIFFNVPDFTQMRKKVEVPIKRANKEKSTKWVGPQAPGWARLSEISDVMVKAVIASEDTSFFSHQGVDFHELQEAIKKDWEEKKFARGGSTITQQVVKNVYLGQQKTLWRKFKEFIWAREIEKVLSKQEIICFYLNMAEWGPGTYGIRDAAMHYFGVSPGLLTAKQAAFLAMLLPSPIKYHAYFTKKELTDFSRKRMSQILRIMYRMGYVDDVAYDVALSEKLWGITGAIKDTGKPSEDSVEEIIPEDPNDFFEKAGGILAVPRPTPEESPMVDIEVPEVLPEEVPPAETVEEIQ